MTGARTDAVTRQDALKILSSTDSRVIRKTVEFWASSIDCYLQDYMHAAKRTEDADDIEFKALMASRIVTIACEMLMFFSVLEADSGSEPARSPACAARLAATEGIQAMVDRQLKQLLAQCEKAVN